MMWWHGDGNCDDCSDEIIKTSSREKNDEKNYSFEFKIFYFKIIFFFYSSDSPKHNYQGTTNNLCFQF